MMYVCIIFLLCISLKFGLLCGARGSENGFAGPLLPEHIKFHNSVSFGGVWHSVTYLVLFVFDNG